MNLRIQGSQAQRANRQPLETPGMQKQTRNERNLLHTGRFSSVARLSLSHSTLLGHVFESQSQARQRHEVKLAIDRPHSISTFRNAGATCNQPPFLVVIDRLHHGQQGWLPLRQPFVTGNRQYQQQPRNPFEEAKPRRVNWQPTKRVQGRAIPGESPQTNRNVTQRPAGSVGSQSSQASGASEYQAIGPQPGTRQQKLLGGLGHGSSDARDCEQTWQHATSR